MKAVSSARSGHLWVFALIATALIGTGLALNNRNCFSQYRKYVGSNVLPATLVRSGRTGKELRLLLENAEPGALSIDGFDKSLRPERMPSTTILGDEVIAKGVPVLSLVVAPADLFDRRTGLLQNRESRGHGWERPVYASYFRDGHLLFATGAGLRIHGGKSRKMLQPSFRLHFNELYGLPGVSRSLIFGGPNATLHSLVVHNDFRVRGDWDRGTAWHYQDAVAHFVNPISYQIARRIGSIVPSTELTWLYVNGEYQGAYALTERVPTADFLTAHFGHDDFFIADTRAEDLKSNVIRGVDAEWKQLQGWVAGQESPLRMQEVADVFDLGNLTNWYIGIVYLGTTDAYQGIVVRNRREAGGRWFWINWDMDHSFRDWYALAEVPWEIDVLRGIDAEKDPRAVLFRRLVAESPEYRTYFLRRLTEVLNHRLTPQFMENLIAGYEQQAVELDVDNGSFFKSLRQFVQKRPAILREQMGEHLQSGPSHKLTVTAEAAVLVVDGQNVGHSYTGWYFDDTPARIEILDPVAASRAQWKVNDQVIDRPKGPLHMSLGSDAEVEIVVDSGP